MGVSPGGDMGRVYTHSHTHRHTETQTQCPFQFLQHVLHQLGAEFGNHFFIFSMGYSQTTSSKVQQVNFVLGQAKVAILRTWKHWLKRGRHRAVFMWKHFLL